MASGIPICGHFELPTHRSRDTEHAHEILAFNMGKCNFEALYLRNGAR